MPINSRNKGARFERRIANAFSVAFNRGIRRVPASGGLDIKCDLYDPENDDFRYFIECKFRESYRFETLMSGTSPLYAVLKNTNKLAEESYLHKKYRYGAVPIVVFKGGEFRSEWVMVSNEYLDQTFRHSDMNSDSSITVVYANTTMFMPLSTFLQECVKFNLRRNISKSKHIIHDEDDGSQD